MSDSSFPSAFSTRNGAGKVTYFRSRKRPERHGIAVLEDAKRHPGARRRDLVTISRLGPDQPWPFLSQVKELIAHVKACPDLSASVRQDPSGSGEYTVVLRLASRSTSGDVHAPGTSPSVNFVPGAHIGHGDWFASQIQEARRRLTDDAPASHIELEQLRVKYGRQ